VPVEGGGDRRGAGVLEVGLSDVESGAAGTLLRDTSMWSETLTRVCVWARSYALLDPGFLKDVCSTEL
jgi:hypothetical protein